jgi:hypothetical protein
LRNCSDLGCKSGVPRASGFRVQFRTGRILISRLNED